MSEYRKDDTVQPRYTLGYRAVEARQVMSWIRAGQSGCLVGLRGAGKSNFLRFLLREDVQQHYLGQGYTDFAFILVDLLPLVERTEWAVCELMLNRLSARFRFLSIEPAIAKEIASLRRDVTHTKSLLTAYRAVERCIDVLCQKPAQRVVLLFDEFDAIFRALDPSLFRCLRAIRDAHKDQISFIVVTNDLACQQDDIAEVEHFYRLVSRNVCGLGPYGETDARQMIAYLASRRSIELSERDTARLVELSGGHAGLIKAILGLLANLSPDSGPADILVTLEREPTVEAECNKVWRSLSQIEQTALCALAGGAKVDSNVFSRLQLKGLVRTSRSQPLLFSPLFADFCRRQAPPVKERIILDRSLGIATIDGRSVELTELELEVLFYLWEHRGRVCTKDELIQNVYHQRYDRMAGGVTDQSLQTLISRLRAKVEPPRCIHTVRGEGYKFIGPGER
jgi:hypothetical protein